MTTTPLPTRGDRRDVNGRPHTAPAWTGDIGTLTEDELQDRIEALGAHIGRLATEWVPSERAWRPRPDFAQQAKPWILMRLCCLAEYDRKTVAGESS